MNEEARPMLFDGRAFAKKALDSWAYILLAFVLFLSVVIGYSKINFNPQIAINLGVEYVLLLAFCAIARYCLDEIAKKNGALSDKYIAALKRSEEIRAKVKTIKNADLDAFCDHYREDELISARKQILSEALLDEEDYELFVAKKQYPRSASFLQRATLRRARRLKPVRLNRFTMGRPINAKSDRPSFSTPRQELRAKTIPDFLATVVTVLFPVSITFSLILNPTLATLIASLMKTFTVIFSASKGYQARMRNMTETVPAFVTQQEDLLLAFEAWSAEMGRKKNISENYTKPIDNL